MLKSGANLGRILLPLTQKQRQSGARYGTFHPLVFKFMHLKKFLLPWKVGIVLACASSDVVINQIVNKIKRLSIDRIKN